ncbi:hypothetical protein ACFL5G_02740 [Candidatus Margulisiibacteriota bacterium]
MPTAIKTFDVKTHKWWIFGPNDFVPYDVAKSSGADGKDGKVNNADLEYLIADLQMEKVKELSLLMGEKHGIVLKDTIEALGKKIWAADTFEFSEEYVKMKLSFDGRKAEALRRINLPGILLDAAPPLPLGPAPLGLSDDEPPLILDGPKDINSRFTNKPIMNPLERWKAKIFSFFIRFQELMAWNHDESCKFDIDYFNYYDQHKLFRFTLTSTCPLNCDLAKRILEQAVKSVGGLRISKFECTADKAEVELYRWSDE